jgi:hypothetical protein
VGVAGPAGSTAERQSPRPSNTRLNFAAIDAQALVEQEGNTEMKARSFISLAWLLLASPAFAGGVETVAEPFEPIDAQPMIDACWKKTYEQRMDVFAAREGILVSVLCLEERIVEQLDALVPQESLSREEAAQQLKATRMAYGLLVWKIYNEHRRCPRECGVIDQSAHVSAVAGLMEDLLRTIVEQRNELEL